MTVDHGMNIDEVRALADSLQKAGSDLTAHAATLDKLVGRAGWAGANGARFKNEWWPKHRQMMTSVASDLHGFSQSARANLSEQVTASSATDGSGSGGAGPGGSSAEWHDVVGGGIFLAGKAGDLHDFIEDFSQIRKLDAASDLFKHADKVSLGPLAAIGTGWDTFNLFDRVAAGDTDGSIRSGIDVGFDIGGLAFPQVALAKGAWDIGYQIGKGIGWEFGEKLGGNQSFINSVVIHSYGGTLTPTGAADLSHRYDGVDGFFTFVGDNASNTASAAKSLWKSVFG